MKENIDAQDEQFENNEELIKVTGMYKDWFLDYASYVILERAVPAIEDGFKPVQRRIMHSMKDLDDGRYNKVANIVGHTMQYHPHGDASIGDAMVQIGQKDLLIDAQGNWGNILTGDRAAAPRYIEARLSKFALEVLYSPKLTEWQLSYDGRKQEPVNLPVKFPLLLAQGAEGIAVGLSTRLLPHNFLELIDASIKHLRGKKFVLYPDFPTGGVADISNYNDGLRGGRVRVRAKINQLDKNTLIISEVPYGTTTTSLIDSILKANDKGKIKIKKIEDNTAAEVEILIHLPSNISPDKTIDALFAFTQCENSIAPLGCVIIDHKPIFLGVSEVLRRSTDHTLHLLQRELEIKLHELQEQWHYASLERIFIENRVYRDIEEEETWEGVIQAIDRGLAPHTKHLRRAVTEEDIVRLTEIRIKRISKFDLGKAQQKIEALEGEIAQVKHHLDNIVDFAVDYFKKLRKDYGEGKQRKTELKLFDDIEASKVIIRNTKLYVNRAEGFVGTSLKKDEYVADCSDIDDVICFTADGKMMVTKVDAKTFIGKDIIHVAIFKKKDKRTIYNMIYRDGKAGKAYVKRFSVTSVTRDRDYDMAQGKKDSKVLYFSANPNGEAEIITIFLRQMGSIKKLKFDLDFSEILIKGRKVKGNIVTKYSVKKIELKEEGVSTLKPRRIWFDETVKRLNVDERGELLGEFKGEDRLLIITQDGVAKTIKPELTTRFDEEMIVLEKWIKDKPISAIYWEPEKERYYVKRFLLENSDKEESFISEHQDSFLELVSTDYYPMAEIVFTKTKGKERKESEEINIEEFISVKGIKALGNQLTTEKVNQINLLDPMPYEGQEEVTEEEKDDEINISEITGEVIKNGDINKPDPENSSESQTKLFDE
ncbi:DNA gyrase/topoisomerase IV subunit A [Gramella sp. AN32]|uniref:DNA gyrase/topoisomerase IV subunit A n=1 Tax=Christiangramia antarctica TaxID=2058158 RepID=A0ABW5X952_9FLAO|nr:DNA gyrase/topoisomerase IV subunit A [Gramella sp. AN32]MCM4157409.1 DNA gyrase/topoisomerase IV subunit A [Gramella sp. AN32]